MEKQNIGGNTQREKLSEPEQKLLHFIVETVKRDGYSPTVREICEMLQIRSTSTVHKYLTRLEEKGYITRKVKHVRSASHVIRIQELVQQEKTDDNGIEEGTAAPREPLCWIPLVGTIAAGQPILAQESLEAFVPFSVNPRQFDASSLFALRIHGDSMIGIGIMDGDVIIVASETQVNDGEIAAVLVGEEATCKRFFREEDGSFRLQPENPQMEPIIVKECQILGKVIASYRVY